MHRRQGGAGKQQKTKLGHDDFVSRNRFKFGDQQTSVRPDCGGVERPVCIYLRCRDAITRRYSRRVHDQLAMGFAKAKCPPHRREPANNWG
jgi:hypothetical protein